MLSQEDRKFLELYSDSEYEKPSVTVDAVIFRINSVENNNYRKLPEKRLQVFLSDRQFSPYKNHFAVVGTFIDLKHELSESMKLCVQNKTGLKNYYHEQLFTFGDKSRDPRTRVISCSYMLLTNKHEELTGGQWFDIEIKETDNNLTNTNNGFVQNKTISLTLSNTNHIFNNIIKVQRVKEDLNETKQITIKQNELAFDHAKIIYYAIERLKNKVEYTDIIFNLLPTEFTLTELKQCYEVVLNEKLLDANFRRKTAKMVLPSGKFMEGKGHRSSQLFTHNPSWIIGSLD